MERRLHADQPVGDLVGQRQPGRSSPATGAAAASRSRSRPAGVAHWATFTATSRRGATLSAISQESLGTKAVPDVDDDTPGGSADATVGITQQQAASALASVPGPSRRSRFSRHGRQRQEALGPDALVDARGRVAPLPDHPRDVPQVLAGPPGGPPGSSGRPQARPGDRGRNPARRLRPRHGHGPGRGRTMPVLPAGAECHRPGVPAAINGLHRPIQVLLPPGLAACAPRPASRAGGTGSPPPAGVNSRRYPG